MYIRRASREDAKDCAPLIYSSASAKFDYGLGAFGNDPIKAIESAFKSYLYNFHKVVVDTNGDIIGTGAFYSVKDARKYFIKALRWMFGYYGVIKTPKLLYRLHQLNQQQLPIDKNTLYVTNIAVHPNKQRLGIATMIVEEFGRLADQRGLDYALDVDADNLKAIKLYQKLGFEYQGQKYLTPFKAGSTTSIAPSCRYKMCSNLSHH